MLRQGPALAHPALVALLVVELERRLVPIVLQGSSVLRERLLVQHVGRVTA